MPPAAAAAATSVLIIIRCCDDLPQGFRFTITMFGSAEPSLTFTAKKSAESMSSVWLSVVVEGLFKPDSVVIKGLLTAEKSNGD